jgi:hypothetical protein
MLQIVAIVFFAVMIFVLAEMNMRRIMRRYVERACTGSKWRRCFPDASKSEIH